MTSTDDNKERMEAPERLGRFRVLERLGVGGMCVVYLAESTGASGFRRKTAIKTLLPSNWRDASVQRRFIREAKLGARLRHPNLVQVLDFDVSAGRHFMRMEYVDGPSLAEVLEAGPVPVELAAHIAWRVADALAYLHEVGDEAGRPLGLVHRDVTPRNVLLSRQGTVKLSDYGILKATRQTEHTRGGVRVGTYAYMSPEQVDGEPVTRRTDLFALGVVLAEMTSGRRPFDGESLRQTLARISARDADLSGVPESVERIVEQAFAAPERGGFTEAGPFVSRLRELAGRTYRGDIAEMVESIDRGEASGVE